MRAIPDVGVASTLTRACSLSFGLVTIVYAASIPGKAFTRYLIEIIGRRRTIFDALAGSIPGLVRMPKVNRTGAKATIVTMAGRVIGGFTALSAFTTTRVHLSEQFLTTLCGGRHIFGQSFGRPFAGVPAPFFMPPHKGSPTIFFGATAVVVGALIPMIFGREPVGLLERFEEAAPEPAGP
jgi:hypothetical protein